MFQNAVRLVNYDHAMTSSDLPPVPRLPSRQSATTRRVPRERALSRDAIAAAALDIVDREGLDALTMRTVAHALGTGPASLYAHVASKEDLLELVVERVIGEVRMMGEPDAARWQEQLKEAARSIRAVFARHRDVARASFARIPLGENALATSEWIVAVMHAGGLPDQVIAYACDLLPLYVMRSATRRACMTARPLARTWRTTRRRCATTSPRCRPHDFPTSWRWLVR